jgi:hypothetical protein
MRRSHCFQGKSVKVTTKLRHWFGIHKQSSEVLQYFAASASQMKVFRLASLVYKQSFLNKRYGDDNLRRPNERDGAAAAPRGGPHGEG